jgi:probable phosphoglycerate mutase
MTIWIARHGETEWNRDGRMQGRLGGPLTERGRAQARLLARAARGLGATALVTSSLPRAVETARVVGDALNLVPATCDAFVETDFGRCGGLTEAEIAAHFPGLRAARERDKWTHRWPGGESYADMVARVRPVALALKEGSLVVAHQSMNRVLTHILGGVPVASVLAMVQPSDVVLRFDESGVAWARVTEGEMQWVPGVCAGVPRLN